jgi:hypothetical protein
MSEKKHIYLTLKSYNWLASKFHELNECKLLEHLYNNQDLEQFLYECQFYRPRGEFINITISRLKFPIYGRQN